MLSGIILYQTTSADTVWYQSVTSRCCPVTETFLLLHL